MNRFARKFTLYLAPFLVVILLFFTFEPYDWFGFKNDAAYLTKPLSSMREIINDKPENIIIGDSRLANLNLSYIKEITGIDYTMLGFGGAKLGECVELFWYASKHTTLKKVLFEVSFYFASGVGGYDSGRIPEIEKQATNLYAFTSRYDNWLRAIDKGKGATQNLIARLLQNPDIAAEPDEDPTAFIHQEIPDNVQGETYRLGLERYAMEKIYPMCRNYSLEQKTLDQIGEIIAFCHANQIELIFVIPPMHVSIFTLICEPLGINASRQEILNFLTARATVYDMEFLSPLNLRDDNYFDGFHLLNEMKRTLADLLFTNISSDSIRRYIKN